MQRVTVTSVEGMGTSLQTPTSGFDAVFIGICIFAAAVVVLAIVLVVRNVLKARKSGIDPFTVQTDLAAKVLNSEALKGAQSKPERLADVDAMLAQGVITATEHSEARASILRD